MAVPDFSALTAVGLNLQAVLDLADLPDDLLTDLRTNHDREHIYRQLILIGHGGRRLWEAIQASGQEGQDPIDDFSRRAVTAWFAGHRPSHRFTLIYPGDSVLGLQRLGTLAGWHQPSPLRIGINAEWGTWFAYRAVVLADISLPVSTRREAPSPCLSCAGRACIPACPAQALADGILDLDRCVAYRQQADSRCRDTCLARESCPVAAEHRYDVTQLRHSYSRSLAMLRNG